ncbi:hypothetical protein MJT46_011248 [Ovis ammon polii x Ovis aries]|nr:hypothetical protein MJT46_011248 [Ovis ammon polii x Ovis aries]
MVTDEATQSKLPSFHWTPRETGALVPAAAPCAHLPPGGVQMNLGFNLQILISQDEIHNRFPLSICTVGVDRGELWREEKRESESSEKK